MGVTWDFPTLTGSSRVIQSLECCSESKGKAETTPVTFTHGCVFVGVVLITQPTSADDAVSGLFNTWTITIVSVVSVR